MSVYNINGHNVKAYNIGKTAQILNINVKTFRRWKTQGIIPGSPYSRELVCFGKEKTVRADLYFEEHVILLRRWFTLSGVYSSKRMNFSDVDIEYLHSEWNKLNDLIIEKIEG